MSATTTAATSPPVADANLLAWRRQRSAFAYRHAAGLFAAEEAIFAELAAELSAARVLDLGIGTGRTSGHLLGRCAAYTGIDYSPAMIASARLRFAKADLRVMDARDLSAFATGSFDIALFSFNGLDYVDHAGRLRVLAGLHRVLRPGGALAFSTHNRGTPIARPRDLANLKLSANPARAAAGVAKYLAGIRNARRMQPLERHAADHALLNDSGQQYSLLTYYIAPAAQARQLAAAGFGEVSAFGLSGQRMTIEGPAQTQAAANDYMIHYLARRL